MVTLHKMSKPKQGEEDLHVGAAKKEQDEPGTRFCATMLVSAQRILGTPQNNKVAGLKRLSLTKLRTI